LIYYILKLCYDYEGNFDTNSYSGTYEEIQEEVHSDHADFCRFYENKSWIGGMLAFIWIPILLLAILAIYCIWLHCCREKENENEGEFFFHHSSQKKSKN